MHTTDDDNQGNSILIDDRLPEEINVSHNDEVGDTSFNENKEENTLEDDNSSIMSSNDAHDSMEDPSTSYFRSYIL